SKHQMKFSTFSNNSQNMLNLTSECLQKLQDIKFKPSQFVRLSVEPGGCHGLNIDFEIDNKFDKDKDIYPCSSNHNLVCDRISLKYVKNSTLHYDSSLVSEQFIIQKNPNSDSGCSCGHSFSPK
ncbi:MAG: Iron-sulfur cluster assembly 2, mitochondrial, partial [Paramarteilia canceri]